MAAKGKTKISVSTMSKRVFTVFIVILVILFVTDFVKSKQNGAASWIGQYMQKHYPELFSTNAVETSSYGQNVVAGTASVEENDGEKEGDSYPFDLEGFLFPNSDIEYLSEDSLYALQDADGYEFKELLGYARNEIYARHGYPFDVDGKYYQHYSQYDWYNKLEHNDVSDSDLNQFEVENVKLVVLVEEAEGFR